MLLSVVVIGLGARPVLAHGFGERYDLPVPLSYFLVGAAAAVALSFLVIGLFVGRHPKEAGYPRWNLIRVRWLGTILASGVPASVLRLLSVGLFALVITAALLGSQRPVDNLSPTFVWIIWWVGMGYVAALLGNLWMVVNPWKITFEWAERLLGAPPELRGKGMGPYPNGWDVWPALLLFLAFAWVENVYSGAAHPFRLGLLVLLYSLITWSGMAIFGKHRWLRCGEAFTVLFGLFSRFSPTEVSVSDDRLCGGCEADCGVSGGMCVDCYECFERAGWGQREINLRPYAVGLARPGRVSAAAMLFVVTMLATVTFDGLEETRAWGDFQTAAYPAASVFGHSALDVIDTVGLAAVPAIFLGVYLLFTAAVRSLSRDEAPALEVAGRFVLSLVPIALAYNLAHFLTLLLIQGQLIVPLASDPFGFGWDLLGTADYRLNSSIISAKFVWFMSVAAIVLGHIIAVYIAHTVSLRSVHRPADALRGQYPMVLLMVGYTATSLWIIAQPLAG